jgi:hypothetical protein
MPSVIGLGCIIRRVFEIEEVALPGDVKGQRNGLLGGRAWGLKWVLQPCRCSRAPTGCLRPWCSATLLPLRWGGCQDMQAHVRLRTTALSGSAWQENACKLFVFLIKLADSAYLYVMLQALPIFLDRLADPITAVLISITVVLIFGKFWTPGQWLPCLVAVA